MKKTSIFQWFLLLIAAFSTSIAFAQEKKCKSVRKYTSDSFPGQFFLTPESLCRALEAKENAESKKERFQFTKYVSGGTCYYKVTNSGWRSSTYIMINGRDYEECEEENKCKSVAGKVTKLSVPAGWAHLDSTGEVRDFKSSGPAPDQVCKGGCQYLLMSNEVVPGSTVYAPKINNGGYHPVFTQYTYAGTDTQCQAETDLTTPSTPPPPPEKPKEPEKPFTCPTGKCPGVVNGEQVCVPCGSAPGQGDGDSDDKDKGKDKKPGDSSGNNNGNDKGDKDGNKDGSSDGTPGGTGNSSGGINGTGSGNGNGTGNGKGSGGGSGSGSGSKSDSTGKRPGESEGEDDGPPPQYGERPELYEPKYKDGVKGVWDEKKGQLKDTKLANLAKKLMPTEKRGNCPSWTFDLNFGRGLGFGTHRLQPPCTIWPMLRAIVLVCALILARKLVFGG